MRALVTGGAGFVGRHLCLALLERGWEVVCVDPIVPRTGGKPPSAWPLSDPTRFKGFTWVEEDCRDYFHRTETFDVAFHLAAMVGGRLMIECDPLAVAEDLAIDADLFRWARRCRPGKVVYFSSSAAYPVALQAYGQDTLLSEDMIDFGPRLGMPDVSYGWAKLTGEYIARLAHKHYGLDVVCYRPFSGYGEDQDLNYPFPSICRRAVECAGHGVLTVWGTGRQSRDFIHIDDCVRFVLDSMYRFSDGSAINLSTARRTSFEEFASLAARIIGYAPRIVGTSDKPEGVFTRVGDRRLQDALDLHPAIRFEEGVRRGIDYQRHCLKAAS